LRGFHRSDCGGVPDNVRKKYAGDPSLRLKYGYAQDDNATLKYGFAQDDAADLKCGCAQMTPLR
jgi:hypothetical protein